MCNTEVHTFSFRHRIKLFVFVGADEYRTIDGSNNNLANPEWGKNHIQLLRDVPARLCRWCIRIGGPEPGVSTG